MIKWLGQVHVVFARHPNWLVKVANAFAMAFGGITGLNWGATWLFFVVMRFSVPIDSSKLTNT